MNNAEISLRLQLAVEAARAAGRLTLKYFGQGNYQVERKEDDSPVTVADREAEQLLRARIEAAFPEDAIVGEEFAATAGGSGYRWILDPIDGTKTFISGVPLFGTMVGVEVAGRSVVGVVYIPGLDEMVYAAAGQGAWHTTAGDATPRAARVSSCPRLRDAVFLTSQVDAFARRGAEQAFLDLQRAAWITRTWGDCYGYLLVATGRAHLMIDPILNIWDAAAIQPILEEAGGVFVDWKGNATIHAGEAVGATPSLLDEVLAIIGPFSTPP